MKLFRRCPECDSRCSNKETEEGSDNCPDCGHSLKTQSWYLDYYVHGERKREVIGTNKRFAEEVMAKRETQIKEGRFFDIKKQRRSSLSEIADDFLSYSRNNKKSYSRDVQLVNHLLSFFVNKKLFQITPILIEEYKSKRLNEDVCRPATVNREIACLKCMYNWAIKNGKADSNPMKQVRLLRENNTRTRYLKPEEIERLLGACPRRVRCIVETALVTGMRRGEILNLKWEDVNFEQKIIVIKNSKNGRLREVPICSSLADTLEECRGTSDGTHVFCSELGSTYKSFNTTFQRMIKKAELENFCFHDLRHTAASYLVMSGVDIVTVKEILGHSSINTTLRYSHLSPVHKREAMETLGSKLGPIWAHFRHGHTKQISAAV